jgi:hypothetical protein
MRHTATLARTILLALCSACLISQDATARPRGHYEGRGHIDGRRIVLRRRQHTRAGLRRRPLLCAAERLWRWTRERKHGARLSAR